MIKKNRALANTFPDQDERSRGKKEHVRFYNCSFYS